MNRKQVKKLFDKYANNKCTAQEIELLNSYLDSFQDKEQLWPELKYDEEIKPNGWLRIKTEIDTEKKVKDEIKKFPFMNYLKYAAIFIGLLGGFLWYQMNTNTALQDDILITDSPIILKTSDHTETQIDVNGTQELVDVTGEIVGKQKGSQISYDKNENIKTLTYNEIIVPDGKKFQLLLSDGTTVHINSGSSFKYPVNFIPEEQRQVFLKGEAYFEVAKDMNKPFIVTTNTMAIKVLGTHFNINSYQGTAPFAVLAEGSVAVYKGQTTNTSVTPTIIRPGEKATIAANNVLVNNVDIDDYLDWRTGKLNFNNEPFVDIIHKIERHYGVRIENELVALSTVKFKGTFENETIIDLLDTFKESAGFHYEIHNNKIIIKNTNSLESKA